MQELDEAFRSFAILLKERIYSGIYTTEDSVRYLFFHSVTRTFGISPNEILLESSHPADGKKEVDMVLLSSETRPEFAFEFKFHRSTGSTIPRTIDLMRNRRKNSYRRA